MSDRFYTDQPLATGDFKLEGAEAHHLLHVRRFVAGDRVVLFNGDGCVYPAELITTEKRWALLHVAAPVAVDREIGMKLHVASALPKGDRADFLLEKLTELGATDFTPLFTERSVVQPKAGTVEKLQRAVVEASKQCGRNTLMRIHSALRWEQWLKSELPQTKWLLQPGGAPIFRTGPRPAGYAVAIGPEGGFSDSEVVLATQAGFEQISLGPRILRVETAALAIAALVGLTAIDGAQ